MTPFPTIHNTDRPDTIAAGILEGKVAILVDGALLIVHFVRKSRTRWPRAS